MVPCAECRVPVPSLIMSISIFNIQSEYADKRTIKVMSNRHLEPLSATGKRNPALLHKN
jgi:hypothetical protein